MEGEDECHLLGEENDGLSFLLFSFLSLVSAFSPTEIAFARDIPRDIRLL